MLEDFAELLEEASSKTGLGAASTHRAFVAMARGEMADSQQAALLAAIKTGGETAEQLAAAAKAMMGFMSRVENSSHSIDTCGTGGDGLGTYNISTAAALITAAAGVAVAKHGNRAQSSKCGSADVLAALGTPTEMKAGEAEASLKRHNFCFLSAPLYHPAMRHVAATRRALKTRTIFNLIGPLMNPAMAEFRLLGVFERRLLEPMAETLAALGVKRAWTLYGGEGGDELTTVDRATVIEVRQNSLSAPFTVDAGKLGLKKASIRELKGGDATANAAALKEVLAGKASPYADCCLLNAAAALVVAGRVESLKQGLELAKETVAVGKAAALTEALAAKQGN